MTATTTQRRRGGTGQDVLRAAIYVRISSDPAGERAGVQRQRKDCERLVAERGWRLVETFEDNDVSAYNGQVRPAFERLLAAVQAGEVDVVVAWASDRLYRTMRDLTRITDRLAAKATIAVVTEGEVDLASAGGIFKAQVMGSAGEFESRRKAERLVSRAKQRARQEHRTTCSRRPFGWTWADPDPADPSRPRKGSRAGLVPLEAEAAAVRELYRMAAEGASIRACKRWAIAQGLVGTNGVPLGAETVRGILTNPRNAGLASYKGEITGRAAGGQKLVEVEVWEQVRARLSDPARRTSPGRPAGTLLSGIAVCGKCGGPMNASNKHDRAGAQPVYLCGRNHHLTRRRALLDKPIVELAAAYLERNRAQLRRVAAPGADRAAVKAADEVAALRERAEVLAALVAGGDLDPADYAAAAREVRARLADAERRAAVTAGLPAVSRLLAEGDASQAFRTLVTTDIEAARAVLREIIERVIVQPPAVPGHPAPTDLRIEWRPL